MAGGLVTVPTVTFNGATVGVCGSALGLFGVRGLDLPAMRSADLVRPGAHGRFRGADWADARSIELDVRIEGDTADDLAVEMAAFVAAFVPTDDEMPFTWQLPGESERRVLARCRRRSHPVNVDYVHAYVATARIEMVATDPLIYDATESTESTALSTAVGGLTFAASAPFVFGSGGTGSTMACTNDGTFPTGWVATFTGPLVAPTLQHSNGQAIVLSGASLDAGETLVVDSADHTVLLNGTVSRYSWLDVASTRWFALEPGANSVQLLGASGSGSVQMAWRSAWI